MIVILDGPSSSGKTTLAHAIRKSIGPTLAAVSIDRLFSFLHPSLGVRWPEFDAISEATFAAAAALADRGFHVVIDTVLERTESVATLQRVLGQREHSLVAVRCSLATLEARERERGNRPIGLARRQLDNVLGFTDYTLHVDSDQPLASYVDRVAGVFSAPAPAPACP